MLSSSNSISCSNPNVVQNMHLALPTCLKRKCRIYYHIKIGNIILQNKIILIILAGYNFRVLNTICRYYHAFCDIYFQISILLLYPINRQVHYVIQRVDLNNNFFIPIILVHVIRISWNFISILIFYKFIFIIKRMPQLIDDQTILTI